MLFFEALKLGYLIHLHPLDNAHAEHTTQKKPCKSFDLQGFYCGERGIRTPDTLLTYTRFPGVPLQPLEHLS